MSERSVFDLELPDFAGVTVEGVWCGFCGNHMVAAWQFDEDTICPERCDQCGAPDAEEMAEYFT